MSTLMYYSDAVNEELNSISSIPKSLIKSGGIKIYTTLDVNAQKKLDDSIKENGSNIIFSVICSILLVFYVYLIVHCTVKLKKLKDEVTIK